MTQTTSEFEFDGHRFKVAAGNVPPTSDEYVIDMQGIALPRRGYGTFIPTVDFGTPSLTALDWALVLEQMRAATNAGKTIRISCTAGMGRSGIALGILLAGLTPYQGDAPVDDPVTMARKYRPGAIERPEQEAYVRQVADELRVIEQGRVEALMLADGKQYREGHEDGRKAAERHFETVTKQLASDMDKMVEDQVELIEELATITGKAVLFARKARRQRNVAIIITAATGALALVAYIRKEN